MAVPEDDYDSADEATETDRLLGNDTTGRSTWADCRTCTDKSKDCGNRSASPDGRGQDAAKITTLRVGGICCPAEVPLIQNILNPMLGVDDVVVNVITKTATVRHQGNETCAKALADALNDDNFDASVLFCGTKGSNGYEATKAAVKAAVEHAQQNRYPRWNILLGLGLWLISMLSYFDQVSWVTQRVDPALVGNLKYAGLVALACTFVPILWKATNAMRHGVPDINILMTIAIIGACGLGEYCEAAAIAVLFSISDWLELRATSQARDAVAAILSLRPEIAELPDGTVVPAEEVAVGTVFVVKDGRKVPLDGIVESGTSYIDEANLTGESVPAQKSVGSRVFAGTINVGGGFLTVRSTSLAGNSTVARLVELVELSHTQTSPTEQRVKRIAKWYTPIVVLTAVGLAVIPPLTVGGAWAAWLKNSLVMLVIACPCALVISTPIVYVCALTRAARCGILCKGGRHLESLAGMAALALDKTGTLTEGAFVLCDLVPFQPATAALGSEEALLQLLAAVEQCSTHPLAAAVCKTADKRGLAPPSTWTVDQFESVPGEGVRAAVNGRVVEVGNARLAARLAHDPAIVQYNAQYEQMSATGKTVAWIVHDGAAVGLVAAQDQPRPSAAAVVDELHRLRIRTVMLTGDNEGSARAVQRAVGLTEVHSGLLPEDKTQLIGELQADKSLMNTGCCWQLCPSTQACVGMLGDGVNDAPALALATVGIAMGENGTAVAAESADVVVMSSDLGKVAEAIRLGKATVSKITENVTIAIVSKLVIAIVSLCGYSYLSLAIAADVGGMLVVTLNGATLLGSKTGTVQECVRDEHKTEDRVAGAGALEKEGTASAFGGAQQEKESCAKSCCGSKPEGDGIENASLSSALSAPQLDNTKGSKNRCCMSESCGPSAEKTKEEQDKQQKATIAGDGGAATAAVAGTADKPAGGGCCKSKSCGPKTGEAKAKAEADVEEKQQKVAAAATSGDGCKKSCCGSKAKQDAPPPVKTTKLAVEGMTCKKCVGRVEKILSGVAGVTSSSVEIGSAEVTGGDLGAVLAALDAGGYPATIVGDGGAATAAVAGTADKPAGGGCCKSKSCGPKTEEAEAKAEADVEEKQQKVAAAATSGDGCKKSCCGSKAKQDAPPGAGDAASAVRVQVEVREREGRPDAQVRIELEREAGGNSNMQAPAGAKSTGGGESGRDKSEKPFRLFDD